METVFIICSGIDSPIHVVSFTHLRNPGPFFFQNFSMEQTIAFRGITLGVFEATIVRGEMDLDGAFEAFTERVLSLAEVPETTTSIAGGDSGGSNIHSNEANNRSRTGGLAADSKAPGTEQNEAANTTASSIPPNRHGVGDNGGERGAVFSVGDIGAITRFVARGLYRNFTLYRMCFEQEARSCREVRHVQVETPLELPPLQEAENAP